MKLCMNDSRSSCWTVTLVTQMPKCRPLLELLHVSGLPLTASINDIEYILTEELRNF